jgi:hypothetical protein
VIVSKRRGIGGHHRGYRGASDVWLTPPEIVAALGLFDLDPCGCVFAPWSFAEQIYDGFNDGLELPWCGRVWLNPPYGPQLGKWLARLAEHGNGIAIAFARTETRAFFAHVWPKASGIFFFRGRIHFYRPNGARAKANAGGPSCLIAYGRNNVAAIRRSGLDGKLIELESPHA